MVEFKYNEAALANLKGKVAIVTGTFYFPQLADHKAAQVELGAVQLNTLLPLAVRLSPQTSTKVP